MTPAIALTAFARSEDRRKALLQGFDNFVAKPVEPSEIAIIIKSLTARHAAKFLEEGWGV